MRSHMAKIMKRTIVFSEALHAGCQHVRLHERPLRSWYLRSAQHVPGSDSSRARSARILRQPTACARLLSVRLLTRHTCCMPTRLDLAGCSCKQFSSRRGHETSIHSHKATESELSPHYAEGEPHIHEACCTVQHYPANNRHTLPYQVLRRSRFLVAHMSTVFIAPRPRHRHPKLPFPCWAR